MNPKDNLGTLPSTGDTKIGGINSLETEKIQKKFNKEKKKTNNKTL